jgi:hypothetical protein
MLRWRNVRPSARIDLAATVGANGRLKEATMLSALLMMRRLAAALRVALREEDFARVLSAGLLLIVVGTLAYSLGAGWSLVDGLYVAVATLTTSSILDPDLTITDPWLKVFTAGCVLVGIGILVEVARRLGMGFIAARAELEEAKATAKTEMARGAGSRSAT